MNLGFYIYHKLKWEIFIEAKATKPKIDTKADLVNIYNDLVHIDQK